MSLSTLTTPPPPAAHRHAPVWLLPLLLLFGFGGLFLFILWDELLPAPAVQTVRAAYAEAPPAEGTQEKRAKILFRATGWIEPDPQPAAATTYIAGKVAEVAVTEGELVQQGQTIARLDAREYELALAHAESALKAAEAHAATAKAALAEAEATLTALRERTANYALRHERYAKLKDGAVSEQQQADALHDYTEHLARTQAQEAALQMARSMAQQALAQVSVAETERDKAQLDLARCTITAPITGRIMKLNAVPGGRLSPGGETVDMSTAATLYDPQRIALSADVPLDQAGLLCIGQQVRISCDAFPDRVFTGRVARIYGRADQTRNTLRCQVSIENPDDMLRPDMQCRGAFYSDGVITDEAAAEPAAEGDLTCIPPSAIVGDKVWIVTPERVLMQRSITRVGDKVRGVLPGEPVVLHPKADFQEGQRVNIHTN